MSIYSVTVIMWNFYGIMLYMINRHVGINVSSRKEILLKNIYVKEIDFFTLDVKPIDLTIYAWL